MIWNFDLCPSNQAIIDETGINLTYEQLSGEGDLLASKIDRRCLVFLMCRNCIGSVLGYTAFIQHGIVPVLLNSGMDRDLLDHLIKRYKPSYIWTPSDTVTGSDQYGIQCVYESFSYQLLKTDFDTRYPLNDELCLLLTTSGSTGSPKFVRQSYRNVLSNAESIVQYLEITSDERSITTLPMNYTYGLSIINSHLMKGATLLVTEKSLMQKEFWAFFREQKATSFGGVPYTYELLEKLRFGRMDLPSLRYTTQAGGKLSPELHRKFSEYAAEKNRKFIVMYGQCEATARMGYLPAEDALRKCGSMGIAIPGGKFRLSDEDGNDISEPNVTGELIYEGPNVTMGYAESGEDLAKGDERNGVLLTGDMAFFDADGYYYINGRKKRFLKIYGNRINLDEIDRLIKAEFEKIDCASAGKDDHLYIFLTDTRFAEKVRRFTAQKTKLNITAFQTIILDEIPRNESGKILYKELEKYYE